MPTLAASRAGIYRLGSDPATRAWCSRPRRQRQPGSITGWLHGIKGTEKNQAEASRGRDRTVVVVNYGVCVLPVIWCHETRNQDSFAIVRDRALCARVAAESSTPWSSLASPPEQRTAPLLDHRYCVRQSGGRLSNISMRRSNVYDELKPNGPSTAPSHSGLITGQADLVAFPEDKARALFARAYLDDCGCWADGMLRGATLDVNKSWWIYAELDQLAGTLTQRDPTFARALPRTYGYWFRHFVDPLHGEVWNRIDGRVAQAMAVEECLSHLRTCARRLHRGAATIWRARDPVLRLVGRPTGRLHATVLLFRHDNRHRNDDG
jgi:hypothetical protein